jgi:DNA-binding protein HU-beta
MNKSQLIDAVATQARLTKSDAAQAVDALTATVQKTLKKGDDVSIPGFGKWSVTKRGARTGRNPATGEQIKIKASKTPKFSAGATLRRAVNGKRR